MRLVAWLFPLPLILLAGCAVNPVTGERELALISEGQEIQMGREAAQSTEKNVGLVEDESLQQYVGRVGLELARGSERPDLPWEFQVVDDPTPNAFALPGGFIFVTRGMMTLMDSEAELAAVLGHEIGHVTARHSVTQLSRAELAQLGLGIGMVVAPGLQRLGDLASTGIGLLFLKYSRDDERQADQLGFRYMAENGYDVREMDDVFVALEQSSKLAGTSPLPSWLASHPSEPERIHAARQRAASIERTQTAPIIRQAEYLQHIDGLVYGNDPREGFFRNGYFYQPELLLQFKVPDEWKKQNTSNAVVAGSMQGDAALQLTLSDQQGIEQAAQAFFSQQGVQLLDSSRERLGGDAAIVSRLSAQTQQGVVQGYVAHIDHRGTVYQLVTYAAAQRFAAYEPLFREIVSSFGPVTDQKILDVQPNRIGIVKLDRTMSLTEFAQRHPSAVSIDELAILNQISDVDAPVQAGTALKRVVGG